mmetsp:Transcript_107383/g.256537  ORF Transcript_107383/g.256537 Transcript_107383/m.256537 type:complete len:217 (+) Transcript_107383:399-1049(+)
MFPTLRTRSHWRQVLTPTGIMASSGWRRNRRNSLCRLCMMQGCVLLGLQSRASPHPVAMQELMKHTCLTECTRSRGCRRPRLFHPCTIRRCALPRTPSLVRQTPSSIILPQSSPMLTHHRCPFHQFHAKPLTVSTLILLCTIPTCALPPIQFHVSRRPDSTHPRRLMHTPCQCPASPLMVSTMLLPQRSHEDPCCQFRASPDPDSTIHPRRTPEHP